MEDYKTQILTLSVEPDPKILKKYHPASNNIWIKDPRPGYRNVELSKCFDIIQVFLSGALHAGYDYNSLADANNINDYHSSNILAIVFSMINVEWSEYYSQLDDKQSNYVERSKEILKEIAINKAIIETIGSNKNVISQLKFKIKGVLVKGTDTTLPNELVQEIVTERLNLLLSTFDYIPMDTFSFTKQELDTMLSGQLKEHLDSMHRSNSADYEDALIEFRRLVMQTIHKYLCQELKKETLTDDLCSFIYSILAIFNLVSINDVLAFDKPKGLRSKATYIRNQLREAKRGFKLSDSFDVISVDEYLKSRKYK